MWLWSWDRTKGRYGFRAVDCPNRLDRVLVAANLSPSVAEATRLIKQQAVRVRRNYDQDWQVLREPRAPLPTGWPCEIRVGRSSWRMLVREGRDGWDGFPTVRELMFPERHQGIRSWTDLVANDRMRWWPYWLDRAERFWNEQILARCPSGPKKA